MIFCVCVCVCLCVCVFVCVYVWAVIWYPFVEHTHMCGKEISGIVNSWFKNQVPVCLGLSDLYFVVAGGRGECFLSTHDPLFPAAE